MTPDQQHLGVSKMEVNGYEIREAIRRWKFKAETISAAFEESLFSFEGEEKESPQSITDKYRKADRAIAELEALQQKYNENHKVDVIGEQMTLALAVKLVGGAGRIEKMWRVAAKGGSKDRFSYNDARKERNKENEYASATVTLSEARTEANKAARFASALRAAISIGNGHEINLGDSFGVYFSDGD